MSRRGWLTMTLGAFGVFGPRRVRSAEGAGLTVPAGAPTERFDFESTGIDGWATVQGQWTVEDMAGAPSGKKVLVQRATKNEYDVIVAPPGPYSAVDVSMKFKPISGKEDASGGLVLRYSEGTYYVVRANALEDNFRLYFFDRGRRQIASARVKPPALGEWHSMRVVAVGEHMHAWLDGTLLLDHRDSRLKTGRVGVWTKADSVTAFDDLVIRGITGGR